ncbi:unnamed protein product [Allacma fusca]|uniref:SEA domain-containing protein n=1 Tax=Allacma fusca TaxID=39272 RepID=A0A8J2L959_9HEXA|nr:unnamed protein product [Allacma fusca]
MSVSSGSDVTIPIQDSPPPPPSPYGNRAQAESERKTPEPRGDVGVDNAAYEPCENDDKKGNANKTKDASHKKGDHTQIPMNGQEPPLLNEALNSELINMNIMNTIPDKPQPEFGPYENPDEYFIAVNQHKKFLRSEKLYVTKDKRKVNSWKKYVCWLMGAIILASIVTVAVLAGLGLISQKSQSSFTESGTTSPSELISSSLSPILSASSDATDEWISNGISSTSSSTTSSIENIPTPLATRPPLPDNHHVPAAADITLTLDNAEYTAALNNKSSDRFHQLATEIEQEMRQALTLNAGLSSVYAKVTEFLPGSVVVKLRLSWMDESKDLMDVQVFMATLRNLGPYQIRSGATTSYGLVNHCKFGNYGCSHYCTFDYEQLDFLCTCPELLSLSEDRKTCIENLQFSSTSASIASIGLANDTEPEMLPESETTLQPESEIPIDDEHIVSEAPVVVQSVSTEGVVPEVEHASPPVADNASEDSIDEPPSEVSEEKETQGETPDSEDSHAPVVVPVASSTESEVENSGIDSTSRTVNDQTPESGTGEITQEEPTESRDSSPEHEASAQRKTPDIVIPIVTTTESNVADRNAPSVIEGEGRDDLMETTLPPIHTQDDISEDPHIPPTESPIISQSSSAVNTSEEESSIGAPLQRLESDNYSEVEKHQQINDTINTTTAGPPIVSFNNSRYSEERNTSQSLSDEISQSQSEESPISHRNVLLVSSNSSEPNHGEIVSTETELISGNAPVNNTRTKTARFESYGEEVSREPSPTPTNATARHIMTNSAEFMVYGDNVLNSSPAQNQPGTDSGLTDHESSQHQSPRLGLLNTNNTENSEESQTTETTQNDGSGSVEVVSSEADASAPKDDSASIYNSDERAGIVFTGNDSNDAGITETPREIEELTTPMPINLENDTLVNENATEDKTNAEPIVITANGREVEVSITTTPFTPEEPAQDDAETTPAPVANPVKNVTEVEVPVTEVPSNPDSEVVPTTIAPVEETTIVNVSDDETATTIPDETTSSTTTTTTTASTTTTTTTTTPIATTAAPTTAAPVTLSDAPSIQSSGLSSEIANNASAVNNESSNASSGNANLPSEPSSNVATNIQLSNSFSPELDANSSGRSNSSSVTVDNENELS